jgi:hypothetical protein
MKSIGKGVEELRWESRLRFIREAYQLYSNEPFTSVIAIQKGITHIAFCLCYLKLSMDKYINAEDQYLAKSFLVQILKILDDAAIDLLFIPKRNKELVRIHKETKLKILFDRVADITDEIEVMLASNNVPLHRYST